MTNAEARFNTSLHPRKPEGSLGRTAQDVHLDSHTAPELWSSLTQLLNYELWRPSRRPQSSYILPLLVYQFETLQCSHWNFSISVRHREFPVSVMSFSITAWWHFFVWHYNKQQEDFSNAAARCIINLILDSDWSKVFLLLLFLYPSAGAVCRSTLELPPLTRRRCDAARCDIDEQFPPTRGVGQDCTVFRQSVRMKKWQQQMWKLLIVLCFV